MKSRIYYTLPKLFDFAAESITWTKYLYTFFVDSTKRFSRKYIFAFGLFRK